MTNTTANFRRSQTPSSLPGRVTNSQWFAFVPPRVWNLLVSRLGTLHGGLSASPPPLPFFPLSGTAPLEGHVHQPLAAWCQLDERAFTLDSVHPQQVKKQGNRDLGIMGCIDHLEDTVWQRGKCTDSTFHYTVYYSGVLMDICKALLTTWNSNQQWIPQWFCCANIKSTFNCMPYFNYICYAFYFLKQLFGWRKTIISEVI